MIIKNYWLYNRDNHSSITFEANGNVYRVDEGGGIWTVKVKGEIPKNSNRRAFFFRSFEHWVKIGVMTEKEVRQMIKEVNKLIKDFHQRMPKYGLFENVDLKIQTTEKYVDGVLVDKQEIVTTKQERDEAYKKAELARKERERLWQENHDKEVARLRQEIKNQND